jgi:ribulose-phosphate 3-epimerase
MLIAPTITTNNIDEYTKQLEVIKQTSKIAHLDLADGVYAPSKLIDPSLLSRVRDITLDVHVMYQNPFEVIEEVIELHPVTVIIPLELPIDYQELFRRLKTFEIKVGLALLADQEVEMIITFLDSVDHVLIFSGNLGYQGGSFADLGLLSKVAELRSLGFKGTFGWDGGVNDANIQALKNGGIDIANVGGFIQKSSSPIDAYKKLKDLI